MYTYSIHVPSWKPLFRSETFWDFLGNHHLIDTTTSTETASRSIRAISSFFSKTSPVKMRWDPLTSTDYGFRHILPIFYQYSTNNSKAFPRYFWNFQEFPRYSTQWKHRIGHFLVLNHASLGSSHIIPLNHWNVHAVDTSRAAVEAQKLWPGPLGIILPNKMFEESKRSLRWSPFFSLGKVLGDEKCRPSLSSSASIFGFEVRDEDDDRPRRDGPIPGLFVLFTCGKRVLISLDTKEIQTIQRTTGKKKNMCWWFTHGLSSVVSNCQQKSTFYIFYILLLSNNHRFKATIDCS